ncbi:ABC transporter ATP-binding protein [uncultured Thiohalocapsa sp.]|uniref:ABC transporter ATP-binding protein n=1 Tax=uncultured Thiohalocapsa sp. TaxID=768990 RepID=UPI0025CF0AEE|nr:ABC transporter ATP-binding protein [uncultured Thiohalocapsa sp.]
MAVKIAEWRRANLRSSCAPAAAAFMLTHTHRQDHCPKRQFRSQAVGLKRETSGSNESTTLTTSADDRNPVRDIPHYLGLFRSYLGRRLYLVFLLSFVASALEAVGIMMLLPLLRVLGSDGAPNQDGMTSWIMEAFGPLGVVDSTASILTFIAVTFVLKGLVLLFALGYTDYLRAQLLREVKTRLFDAYSHMQYGYYTSRDTGYFTNIVNAQISKLLSSFLALTNMGSQLVMVMVYVGAAFIVAWTFGMMAVGFGIVLFVIFRKLNVYVRKISRATSKEQGILAKLLVQAVQSFKYLTATAQGPKMSVHIDQSVKRLVGFELRNGLATSFTRAVREPAAVLFITAVMGVQVILLEQPLAPIIVAIVLFYRGFNAVMTVQQNWQSALSHIGGVELVRDEFVNQQREREPDGHVTLPPLTHGIELRNVRFSYAPGLRAVVQDVSMHIKARTSVALVGESGAGKSTIADLITLMLRPQQGEVFVDGVAGADTVRASWREQIGYVSQETVIFDDSIANNICMWAGDFRTDAGLMQRIQEVADRAHASEFIEELSDGYRTLVGDRGVRLSGGQRQRLFIARELFREPKLLILDEATSALDSDSEAAIQESIDALRGKITVVIIAHRLSTIKNVDHVFVFDKGRLVEDGEYEELRDRQGTKFGRLVAMQSL